MWKREEDFRDFCFEEADRATRIHLAKPKKGHTWNFLKKNSNGLLLKHIKCRWWAGTISDVTQG